jgi:HTH-type transcriptional regulator/antitoxin HigA
VEDYENRNCPITTPSLADVLRLRMNELNINQTSLANMLNVSPSRISEYLAGKEPSLRVAGLMYEKLGVSAKVIFGIKDTVHVSEPELVA